MLLFKIFKLKKEAREWSSDPGEKAAEWGLDIMGTFLTLPVIILGIIAIPSGFLFLILGYKVFLVLFWLSAIPLLIWSWISSVFRRMVKRFSKKAVSAMRGSSTKKRPQVIDVDATEV